MNEQGFTLLELLLVLTILSVLFLVLTPKISAAPNRAKMSAALNDLRTVELAVRSYFVDKGVLPSAADLKNSKLLDKDLEGTYPAPTTPWLDPWGKPYSYEPASPRPSITTVKITSQSIDGNIGNDDLQMTITVLDGRLVTTTQGF
ncbi:type II secretion system protein GspG [Heliobacterium chlorum]|uniref:Type II secretion system protein GspG n=1 Tax=Heliobacterium chlorum TaxID=2698 RepID=A0ABR7T2C9_HELCL|nr:type II secretion system protein GspG [Heliobacterium chlorum]MBC9784925.1 type II secretion system protein GspG [Heliobacterium chlorum]